MVFEIKSVTEKFKVQNLPGAPKHIYFTDLLGTRDNEVRNPIVGAWFRIERGEPSTPPKYEYDEVGVVIEGKTPLFLSSVPGADITQGSLSLCDVDEGTEKTIKAGDTFVIYRGSTIAFSTTDYGIAWKCGSRLMARL